MVYERPEEMKGITRKIAVGCGSLYVTLNVKEDERFTEYPLNEIWIQPSFKDKESLHCCNSFLIPFSRLLTFTIRRIEEDDRGSLIKQLHQHECPKRSIVTAKSCIDAVARVLLCYWEGHKHKGGRCYVCGDRDEKS